MRRKVIHKDTLICFYVMFIEYLRGVVRILIPALLEGFWGGVGSFHYRKALGNLLDFET